MNIVIEYDSSAANAPAGFKEAVQAAVQFYDYLIVNPITVPIVFSYGEIQGQTISNSAAAESSTNGNIESFSSVVSLLTAAATSPTDKTAIANLPTTDPTNGGQFWVSDAQAQVFGLGSEPGYTDPEDGFVGISSKLNFSWDPTNRAVAGEYDAVGALEHEIAEVLGRYDYLGGSITFNGYNLYAPLDLFRFTATGARTVAYGPGYFSIDGGKTLQLPFNDPNNGGDGGDWASSVYGDSYGSAFTGAAGYVSATDQQVMDVLGYQLAPLGNPVAGATPTVTATNGAQASFAESALTGLITNDYTGALTILSASLDAAFAGAGTLSINSANQTVVFTPAAGFAGVATGTVTISDNNGGSVSQPIDFNVVVQASAPVVTAPNTTTTTVNGNVTTIQTFSPTGALISTETISVNGAKTQTQYFNAAGTQTAATITQVNGAFTQVQNFDGNWNQLNASITNTEGGGNSVVQNFDGSWNQTGAVVTTVNGSKTQVQTFNASWVQLSATITTVNGAVTQTQTFDGNWNQTSANLTTTLTDGAVQSQNFNASWQQTSATIATVANGQTTTQSFNGSWTFLGATIDAPFTSGALTDQLDTYGATWNQLSEVDTAANGGQSYFIWGQAGGAQTFTAASAHSTTFIFTPGTLAGDAIAGLHTLNLGGAIHDVIDFEGYAAGAHLVQVNSTEWQVVATGDASETFSLTGGETLGAGDYAFVAGGSQLTLSDSSVGDASAGAVADTSSGSITASSGTFTNSGASTGVGILTPTGGASIGDATAAPSAALFNQLSASGFSTPPAAGVSALVLAPSTHTAALIAPPQQL